MSRYRSGQIGFSIPTPAMWDDLCQKILDSATPVGIELGSVEVGCTKDANGVVTGKVYLTVIKNEDGTDNSTALQHISYADGVITDPYSGPIEDCGEKSVTVQTKYINEATCDVHTLVTCMEGGAVKFRYMSNPDGSVTDPADLTGFTAVSAGALTEDVTLEQEITYTHAPAADFNGTVADILALAIAAAPADFEHGAFTQAVTAAEITAYDIYAMPSGSSYLATPGDLSTETPVTVDKAFIDSKRVRNSDDDPFAGVNLTAAYDAALGSVVCFCFRFKLAGTIDKTGDFTPTTV